MTRSKTYALLALGVIAFWVSLGAVVLSLVR